jgi:hypothetical protein
MSSLERRSPLPELEQSHEFADDTKFSLTALEKTIKYWIKEQKSPDRSDRQKQDDIEPIIRRGVFELYSRQQDAKVEVEEVVQALENGTL